MPQSISQKFLAQDQVTNPGRGFTLAAKLLTQSWSMDVPVAPGTVGQSLRAVAPLPGSPDKIQLEWYTPSASIFNSAVGSNLVLAGPPGSGSPGNPTFRDLGYLDIDQIVGVTTDTIAAGNDPRFHDQNTDIGTTSPTFILNSLGGANAAPVILKVTPVGLEIRNATDTDYADIRFRNVITGNQVDIGDNKILLNADVPATATPTEDGGISLSRGNQVAAEMVWNEAERSWQAGYAGELFAITRHKLFTIGTIGVAGSHNIVTFGHNFGSIVGVTCMTPDRLDFAPASIEYTDEVTIIDFGGISVTGQITIRIDG